nr:hypothetical protein Iba_chr15aCG8960 [Ipomoea batatas]
MTSVVSLPWVTRLVIARSNGIPRSKMSAPEHPLSSLTLVSADALGVAKGSRPFRHWSDRHTPPSTARTQDAVKALVPLPMILLILFMSYQLATMTFFEPNFCFHFFNGYARQPKAIDEWVGGLGAQ